MGVVATATRARDITPVHTLRVLLALGPLAVSFLRDHKRWIWWGAALTRSPAFHARRARTLVRRVVRLGPSFVKISQVFASRADLIPEPYLGELAALVDQVPAMPFEDVARTIQTAYGRGVDDLFERFEREPVAAASLAQVHRAYLNGQTVAVKILRPGVEERLAADITAARRILRALDRWWGHPHIKRELTTIAAFETRVAEEVDFRQEAVYATTIRANFADNDEVVIPRIVDEMTRQRVLVMEFVHGTRIDRLDTTKVDVTRVVQTLVEIYVQMELIDGLFHADPHPGNVMVDDRGRIVLVDFGAVVRVPISMRKALVHTSIAAIRRDADAVAQGFYDMGLANVETDRAHVRWVAQLLIEGAYSQTTSKERIDTLLADRVMKTLFNSPIALTEESVYFARAAALIEGIGTRYDPYFQIVPVASPVVLRMRTRILRSLGEPVTPNVDEMATVAGYALGRAARWVTDKVKDGWKSVSPAASVALLVLALGSAGMSGCVRAGRAAAVAAPLVEVAPAPAETGPRAIDARCDRCGPVPMRPDLARAIEGRIAALKARGGGCSTYGDVLERSYANGQITLRPFMWRVGANLAAGAATAGGDLATAVEIDSLNVGRRSLDDVLKSIEHEAAHVAFQIPSRDYAAEAAVDRQINECRAPGP